MTQPTPKKFKWSNPFEWLQDNTRTWSPQRFEHEFWILASKMDSDELQDEYENCMREDGYFEEDNP